ncbi:hypothetical protein JZU46_07065 [bacterium]|nr:hypothetical protein [bacterium]
MSKIANDIYSGIKNLFPHDTIIPEYYVNYKNTRLLYDFYIKRISVCIECQGRQHSEFVKHFHGDKEKFYGQKRRDNLKIEYCEENELTLVYFYDTVDKITDELILNRIYEALDK